MKMFKKCQYMRYLVCLIAWLALLASYSQRVNLSIGIIGMVQPKGIKNDDPSCPIRYQHQFTTIEEFTQKFNWDESTQNYLLLAYNIGYMIGHVPGAFLALHFGSRKTMIFCLLFSTIFTFASVFVTPWSWAFFASRILIGLTNGPLYPLVHETIANHSPPKERTFLTLLTHTGNLMSLALILPLGGFFIQNYIDGWKYIFYFSGSLGVVATIMWTLFVYTDVEENIHMTESEKNYIIESIYPNGRPPKKNIRNVPFKSIFTTRHIYVFTMVHFGKLFILYMNLFGLVKYLYKYYTLSPIMAGNLAVIPFAADFGFQLLYPKIVSIMQKYDLSITSIRKINTFIGALGCSGFLIGASFISCRNLEAGLILVSLSSMFLAPYQAGYFTAIIEHAPQFAGTIFAFINIGGTFSGVVQRYLMAYLTRAVPDIRLAYRYSFLIGGVVSFLFSIVYVIYGTAELQPWAKTRSISSLKEKKKVET